MSGMAQEMAARIAADGGLGGEGDPEAGAAAVPGTGSGGDDTTPSAGTENTETGRGGPPESIPYSRFQEVNSQYQSLKEYEQLAEMGIEADSALRLANFEAAYVSDPKGIISSLIDNQEDLTDEAKTAMKSLLSQEPTRAGAGGDDEEGEGDVTLPADVQERLAYVDELRSREAQAESQQRLDHVVGHWNGLDEQDGVSVPERTKLVWIQATAARGGFETLEQLSEAARAAYYEDRDQSLGSVVRPSAGAPRTVPGSAAAAAPAEEFKDFKSANKQILADIREGRLPGIEQES